MFGNPGYGGRRSLQVAGERSSVLRHHYGWRNADFSHDAIWEDCVKKSESSCDSVGSECRAE
jgi:hypothetical protein